MKFKRKAFKAMRYTVSAVLLLTAVFCVCRRLPEVFSNRDTALAAAAFTLTDGKYYAESGTLPENTQPAAETAEEEPTAVAAAVDYTPPEKDKSGYYDSFADHSGEAVYDIEEKTIAPMGVQVDGCYLRNYTDLSPDFDSILTEKLPFAVDKASKEPQVLIYHTHTGEGYLDADVDYFYESYYSRTNNNGFNVVAVGDAITAGLEKNGIKTVHDTTVHDSSYNGSYERSAQTVLDDMEKYPGLKVVLDIHRDALGSEERKVKTVFEHDGKKGGLHAGELKAYIQLCLAMSERAKSTKHASPKPQQTENEKYALRCWLLNLGFIGDEFKTAREILLKNMEGNAAWRFAM